MPTINKKKICNKHGIYQGDRCPKCATIDNKTYDKTMRAKDRKKIYNSNRWKKVRLEAMIRDDFMCCECRRNGIDTQGKEVDHVKELKDNIELAYDVNNLEYLCVPCHRAKTEKEKRNRLK